MNNANLISYYSLLFSTEIAVFGIIGAVILVFVQLVYSNYSYRHISHIVKNTYLILFMFFSVIDLVLTATAIYMLVVGVFGPFTVIEHWLESLVVNPIYALACLLLIFVSISFFVILIVKNIAYLQPYRAIFLLAKSIRYKDIRNFIWRKYTPEIPYNLNNRRVTILYSGFYDMLSDEGNEEQNTDFDTEIEILEKQIQTIKSEIQTLKLRVANAEDPLLPVRDMMIQFIQRSDISSLNEASSVLTSISHSFISDIPNFSQKHWNPESSLPIGFTSHLLDTLRTLIEIAEKENLESAEKEILQVSYPYAIRLLELGHSQALEKVEEFWQDMANASIGRSSSIYQMIIEYYSELGKQVFDSIERYPVTSAKNINEDTLSGIFQNVGWLGERMLAKVPLEDLPLMPSFQYSSEYDALLNCLLTFSDIYDREHPALYPLIYFDALYAVLRKMIQIYKTQQDRRLKEHLFSVAYAFSSFAERAIKARTAPGAALAVLRAWEAYQEFKKASLDEHASDCIESLARVGLVSAAYQNELERVEFMSKPIHEWISDKLVESGENLGGAVMDAYIHGATETKGSHDSAWAFITTLGKRMGTNFGFMFDPSTGERYPENDPRRRQMR